MAEIVSKADVAWQDEMWIGRLSGGVLAWTQILGIESLNTPERTPEDIDVTHMQSPGRTRETIPGLMAAADWSQEKQMWATDAGDVLLDQLASLSEAGTPEDIYVEFSVGGIRRTYRGHVMQYTPGATVGEKRMVTTALKVFNRVLPDPRVPGGSASPVNDVPPHVMGSPVVGQTLTAWPGIWTGGATLSYQWKAAGANISGATAQTLVLASGHVGKTISVTVTGTNTAGATPVTSTATAAVTS